MAVYSKDNDGWGGDSNFLQVVGMAADNIKDLSECIFLLEKWFALNGDWIIFDGRTFMFYVSNMQDNVLSKCKRLAALFIENPDFTKIKFVEGLPDAKV